MRPPATPSKSLRIVVTDDDPRLLVTIVEMLVEAGHAVFAAYDGRSACELAHYIPDLDLVISNTRMCNVAAPELIIRVRESKPWLAILHIGDPLPGDGPLHDVPTLAEPFTSAELTLAITKLLAARAQSVR
jgi:CheY-like chemotaxis protein